MAAPGALLPLIMIAFGALCFACASLMVKELLDGAAHLPIFQVVLVRGGVQLVLCMGILARVEPYRRSPLRWCGDSWTEALLLGARGLLGFFGTWFSMLSISRLSLGDSQALRLVSPLFAAIFGAVFLRERWLLVDASGALIAIAGSCLVVQPAFIFGGDSKCDGLGVLYSLACAAAAGGANVLVRALGTRVKVDWPVVMLQQALYQTLIAAPLATASWVPLARGGTTATVVTQLAAVGAFAFAGALGTTWGMQRQKSAAASAMKLAAVPFAFGLQAVALADPPRPLALAGAAVVVGGLLLIVFIKARDQAREAAATAAATSAAAESATVCATAADHYDDVGGGDNGGDGDGGGSGGSGDIALTVANVKGASRNAFCGEPGGFAPARACTGGGDLSGKRCDYAVLQLESGGNDSE